MKNAGKRYMLGSWQKISLLSDIALLAPMIGLLGTVLGMFYAFYDVNRSIESLASLFDGLGVSVGTTVAGLLVALSSMALQTVLKHKLISGSSKVETVCEETSSFVGAP
jgi:biopolymer transport protein ExbB